MDYFDLSANQVEEIKFYFSKNTGQAHVDHKDSKAPAKGEFKEYLLPFEHADTCPSRRNRLFAEQLNQEI